MRILAALLIAVASAGAAEVGQKIAPVELVTYDDRSLTFKDFQRWRATVFLFLSARCPATEAAIDAINDDINGKFRLREVLLVGVFPNADESGQEIRQYAQRRGFMFPFYRDPQKKTAGQFGARVTPEAFVVSREGVLVYRGAISGVSNALAAVLENKAVETAVVPAEGTPLGRKLPARPVEDRYGSIWFSSELIFEKIPNAPAHHASTIVEAANGDLLVVWYGGSYESSDDEALFLARRKKGERSWGTPEVLIQNSIQPPGNAVVFKDGTDRIWIAWGRMEAPRPIRRGSGWGEARLMYRTSTDHGRTWSDDKVLIDALGALPRNVPITLKDGTLLLPLSGRLDGQAGSFFLMTKDNGKTWQRSSVIAGGGQPTVVERADGSLLTLLRSRPRIPWTESRDGGRTWTAAQPTELKNPGAGIAMTRLRSGNLVLVFNDSETSRTPLSIVLSRDHGKTWEEPRALETTPGEYSYPSVIQGSDGRIHITYTYRRYSIKHVELDESWMTRVERPD